MRIGLAAAAAFLLACGKEPSRQRTATSGNASPATKATPATPSGVIGCNDLTLAVPDESKTDLIVVTIDAKAYGLEPGAKLTVGLAFRSGVTAYLERYERPITGETHCTDLGTEPQTPVRYAAVAGRVTIEIVKAAAARPPAWPTYRAREDGAARGYPRDAIAL
jgi:hypothetical protein